MQHGQSPASIIVMIHNPWHYYEATTFRTMMIPNNDLDTILAVANSYQATHLILPAPRPALEAIYNGDITDPHLEYLATVEGQKIYRFHFNP
jgi:hypothetical protein